MYQQTERLFTHNSATSFRHESKRTKGCAKFV